MIKIMFVCHGNICRSPCAEFVMKKIVREAGAEGDYIISSAATSTEEIGNGVYPPMKKELASHGISCKGKYAVQLRPSDYARYDLFLCMDDHNLFNICRIFPEDPDGKIRKLLSFAGREDNVADPWYTGRFDVAYADILEGCEGLLEYLKNLP